MKTYAQKLKQWAKQRERIYSMQDAEWKPSEIARAIGISHQRVAQILRKRK